MEVSTSNENVSGIQHWLCHVNRISIKRNLIGRNGIRGEDVSEAQIERYVLLQTLATNHRHMLLHTHNFTREPRGRSNREIVANMQRFNLDGVAYARTKGWLPSNTDAGEGHANPLIPWIENPEWRPDRSYTLCTD